MIDNNIIHIPCQLNGDGTIIIGSFTIAPTLTYAIGTVGDDVEDVLDASIIIEDTLDAEAIR